MYAENAKMPDIAENLPVVTKADVKHAIQHMNPKRRKSKKNNKMVINGISVARALSHRLEEEEDEEEVPIHQLARDGNLSSLKNALQRLNERQRLEMVISEDDQHLTPLHYAARYNRMHIVEILCDYGADVNAKGSDGITPLHFAARFRKMPRFALPMKEMTRQAGKLEKLELKNENNPSSLNENDADDLVQNEKITETSATNNVSATSYLIEKGADVNASDQYGLRPLHYASLRNNEVIATELLGCPQIIADAVDAEGMTPLHSACAHGALNIAKMLLAKGASAAAKDEQDNTPAHLAAQEGHLKIVELLIEKAESQGLDALNELVSAKEYEENTMLHLAVDSGHFEIAQLLIKKGSDVNSVRKLKETPLHGACVSGRLKVVKLLLENGAQIDPRSKDGQTPLHKAAEYNHFKIVNYLLQKGANMEVRDLDGYTPFLIACMEGHSDTVAALLTAGADATATDKFERSALFWAAKYNNYEIIEMLAQTKFNDQLLNRDDRYNNVPLHIASQKGYVESVKILLREGANIDAKNEKERTPLHLAAMHGRKRVIRELLSRGNLIINDEDEECNTPLHLAALTGHCNVIQLLLQSGADIAARNSYLWTPVDCAAAKGFVDSAKILLDWGAPIDPVDKTKVDGEQETLLGHPLVLSLLRSKWNNFGRQVYYSTLLLYTVFLVVLTTFIIESHPPYAVSFREQLLLDSNTSLDSSGDTKALLCLYDAKHSSLLAYVSRNVIPFILVPLNLMREFYQFYRKRLNYFSSDNILELAIYVSSGLLVFDFTETCYVTDWQWKMGALSVCLAWLNLVLFLQKFPRWGIFVVMIKDILGTFSRFFFVFFLFLVAFSLAFSMLLANQAPFENFGSSLLKTCVMMIGEMEFDSIFNNDWSEGLVEYDAITYVVFVAFLIIMTIIIANLLVGLAVDDIKAVQDKAKLKKLAMQVDLVLEVEMGLPLKLRKSFMVDTETIYPNRKSRLAKFWSSIISDQGSALSRKTIAKELLTDASLTDGEKLNNISDRLTRLEHRNQQFMQQTLQIKSMLLSLLNNMDVTWEDEDMAPAV